MTKKQFFNWYMLIGILYVVVKVIFVAFGLLRPQAIIHGLIPGLLTIVAGFVCKRNANQQTNKKPCKWLLLLLPALVLVTTPPYMYLQMREEWLSNGRLPMLIIYEAFALIQIYLVGKINKEKEE